MGLVKTDSSFPTTHVTGIWDPNPVTQKQAMEKVMETYRAAVYRFLLRTGKRAEEADEITQDFFVHVVCGRGLFLRYDRERRLRYWVLAALKNHMRDMADKDKARSKGRHVALRETDGVAEHDSTDRVFVEEWHRVVLEEALRRCGAHYVGTGKPNHWRLYDAWVVGPRLDRPKPPDLGELARECGFASRVAASAAMQTVGDMMDTTIREVIGETVSDKEEAEAEYQELVRTFGWRPAQRAQ